MLVVPTYCARSSHDPDRARRTIKVQFVTKKLTKIVVDMRIGLNWVSKLGTFWSG